ncbi:hypothetical protein AXF42_Ash013514 [Apostasia shenzhenica]|uniref:Uncharacterized protein n=1 Tax=Apostasia shenzhenica TaxID=1088818 RepID=A0A2I0A4F1_9ASPA|nr:hypothetical protein AXF42_Ash013514 [Apostasia shenzhenica]
MRGMGGEVLGGLRLRPQKQNFVQSGDSELGFLGSGGDPSDPYKLSHKVWSRCLHYPALHLVHRLPTQFYTAMLYTAVTAVLLLQTLYYDYFCRFQGGTTFKNAYNNILDEHIDDRIIEGKKQPLIDPKARERAKPVPTAGQHSSNRASPRTEFYFTSARSLASSGGTPSHQQLYSTYLGRVGSGPSAAAQLHDSTSDDEDSAQSHSYAHHRPSTKPKPIFSHSAGYATLIIGSVGLPSPTTALVGANAAQDYGRRLLQGLNPFMFIFAITANATYVGRTLSAVKHHQRSICKEHIAKAKKRWRWTSIGGEKHVSIAEAES